MASNEGEVPIEVQSTKLNPVLPTFSDENTKVWLSLVELAFQTYDITDEKVKCYLTITALPSVLRTSLSDKITSEEPLRFEDIKASIIRATSVPSDERIKRLLNDTHMGDRTPTQYLRYLRELAGQEIDGNSPVIKSIFMDNLPGDMLMIIAPTEEMTLDQMAIKADGIHRYGKRSGYGLGNSDSDGRTPPCMPVYGPTLPANTSTALDATSTSAVNYINSPQTRNKDPQKNLGKLEKMVEDLTNSLNALQIQIQTHQKETRSEIANIKSQIDAIGRKPRSFAGPSDSDNRNRQTTSQYYPSYCSYHQQFGYRANNCQAPCSWRSRYQQKNL